MRVALWIKARIGKTISYIPRLRLGKRSFILEVQTPTLSERNKKESGIGLLCAHKSILGETPIPLK